MSHRRRGRPQQTTVDENNRVSPGVPRPEAPDVGLNASGPTACINRSGTMVRSGTLNAERVTVCHKWRVHLDADAAFRHSSS